MQGNAQRLLRQVNQLLDLSAVESGQATVAYEERDIKRFVEGVVDGFQAFAQSKDLSLSLRGPDDLPRAFVDPEKLDKVLCNLLSNACKFTPAGGNVLVRLSADDRTVQIAVKDSGGGIADKDQERVFERFQQLDDAATRQHEGSGIGLALARELTELTGGRLTLESEPGFGSTFTVLLPLGRAHIKDTASIRDASAETEPHGAETAVAALAAEAGTTTPPETGKLDESDDRPLVLVVEDNPDMRRLVAGICAADFRVQEAADGEQALERIARRRPDLVISDVMMPRMDGRELLRRIRENPETASLPVMLLTARAGEELRLEGLEQGADDYLVKPFESRELLARARNLVRLQQQERELREQQQELRELNLSLQSQVVDQAAALTRARALARYLPPQVARQVLEQGQAAAPQERRRISVFLLELSGFEQLLAGLEPEEMAALLNSYLSEMVELAFAHGATIDRFDRDRIRGFFGAPISEGAEEDATRGVALARAFWERACDVTTRCWARRATWPRSSSRATAPTRGRISTPWAWWASSSSRAVRPSRRTAPWASRSSAWTRSRPIRSLCGPICRRWSGP
jgi:DNA-binding response OmpR family regulator/anti-sigma regulatory factor (Ser/Thr protein kinase)